MTAVRHRAVCQTRQLQNAGYIRDHSQLHCVATLRLRGVQIEVFKILIGYENIDRNVFFSVKEERRTRGHGVTLAN